MNQDFVDLLRAFTVADVRFQIVGAYALASGRVHRLELAYNGYDSVIPSTVTRNSTTGVSARNTTIV